MLKKIFNKLIEISGVDEVLQDERVKSKKLMKGNAILSDKRIYKLLCIGITATILIAVNIIFNSLINIGNAFRGNQYGSSGVIISLKIIPFYLFGLALSGVLCFILYFKIRINFKELNVGQKGNARFMTAEEIADRFLCIDEKDTVFEGYGGTPVARVEDKMYIDTTVGHSMIYAVTRGGKSEGIAIPSIDTHSRSSKKSSLIIPDVKGTTTNASVSKLLERGYDVFILDFFNVKNSMFYNPLEIIIAAYNNGEIEDAVELATALAHILFPEEQNSNSKFWTDAPRSLFRAIVLAIIEDALKKGTTINVNMFTVFTFYSNVHKLSNEKDIEKKLDSFFKTRDDLSPARLAYTSILFSEEKTRSSVVTLAISKIDMFSRHNVAKVTAKNSIELKQLGFGEKPIAVFLRLPFYSTTYDAIVSIFISQAFYMNMKEAALPENAGKMQRRVHLEGDEIFNFPKINDFQNLITVSLGTGWSCNLYAQSYIQPEEVYGKHVAQIIRDNCATTYFLASPDEDTREKISKMCGNITVENVTRSGERFSLNKTITEQYEERRLITANELQLFMDGEMVVFPSMQRRNIKGEKIVPRPILNVGETALKYRYEYLEDFDLAGDIPYDQLDMTEGMVTDINLHDYVYKPDKMLKPEPIVDERLKLIVGCSLNPLAAEYISERLPKDLEIDLNTTSFETLQDVIKHEFGQGNITGNVYKALMKLAVPPVDITIPT